MPADEVAQPPQPIAGRSSCALRLALLLLICILERCTYYQYMAESIDTKTGDSKYCGVLGDNSTMLPLNDSWGDQLLRSTTYLLPAVGGALADGLFGCVPVLRFASVLYTFGTWLLVMAVYLPGKQNPLCSLQVKYIYEAIVAVASGFSRPCLLTLAYEAGQPLMGPIALVQLFCLGEFLGPVIGSGLAYGSNFSGVPLTGACLVTAFLMMAQSLGASVPERRGWQPDQFHLLGRHRVKRLALVFFPVIILTTSNVLGCFTLDERGAAYFYRNLTDSTLTQRDFLKDSDLLQLIYSTALLVCMLALMVLTRAVPVVRSPAVRIGVGLVLGMVSQMTAFLIYRVPLHQNDGQGTPWHLYIAFGSLNCLFAASNVFSFSTMNELALLIAPGEIRAYTVGLAYSLWGTGFMFSLLVQWISYTHIDDPEKYFTDTVQWVCLTLGCVLVAAIAYFAALAPKAIRWLIDIEAEARSQEETTAIAELSEQ